jgi:centriolar protein POC1
MFSLYAHDNWVKSAEFSPDTRLIASGSDDRSVKLWDMTSKSEIHTFTDHLGGVNKVRFHPDGTCIASGSSDRAINIWDIRSSRLIQHYDAHNESVESITFHPNGRYLVSSSQDSTVKVWDLRQGHILYTLYGHEGAAGAVDFSPSGDYFLSGGADATLMVWKSNLNQFEQELIDDHGGKTTAPATFGGDDSKAKRQSKTAATRTPTRAQQPEVAYRPVTKSSLDVGFPAAQIEQDPNCISGTGQELQSTLEKVVVQMEYLAQSLSILE